MAEHEFEEVIVAPYVVRCAVCGKPKYPHHDQANVEVRETQSEKARDLMPESGPSAPGNAVRRKSTGGSPTRVHEIGGQ